MKVKLDLKRTLKLSKSRVPEVLLRQYGLIGRDSPVDSQAFVQNAYPSIRLRVVELVAFVLENRDLAKDGEAVGEAARDEELPVVFLRELYGDVLPVGRAAFAYVHCDVEHRTAHTPHQLALGEGRALEVQASHHAVAGHRFVVLDEADAVAEDGSELFVELALREGFKKVAARVVENAGLEDQHAVEGGLEDFHILILL